jgi:hypothetical protein
MANRADPFYSATTRLKRAKEHILRLDKRTKRFFQTVATANIIAPDTDGITELHKVKLGKPLPESCDVAATEAIQALRDTLDYTGAASAIAAGHAAPTTAKFPFGDTPADVDSDMRRGGKQLPPEIQALFRGFKPYDGGNNFLWPLNKLRNPATNRILVPIVTIAAGIHFRQVNLLNLMKFLTLRYRGHSQYEIRVYANAIRVLARTVAAVAMRAWETDGQSVSTGDCGDLHKHMTGTGGWPKSEPQPAIFPAEWIETIDVSKEFSQSGFDPARGMQSEPQPAILPAE